MKPKKGEKFITGNGCEIHVTMVTETEIWYVLRVQGEPWPEIHESLKTFGFPGMKLVANESGEAQRD